MTNEEAIKWLNVERQLIVEIPQDNSKELKEAYDMAIKALEQEQYYKDIANSYEKTINKLTKAISEQQPCEDCISRKETIEWLKKVTVTDGITFKTGFEQILHDIEQMPSVTPKARWIPVSEKLPEDLEPVNITWVNHNPESYYADIKDKPFTATGVYFNGQWYWWSTLCTDMLAEYCHNYSDIIDDDIEITAWKPLPQPYAESEDEE